MDEVISEAFKAVSFKPPSNVGQMACWAHYAREAGIPSTECFKRIGLTSKQISYYRQHWENGLSNYQRKVWADYDKLYSLEVRFIISKI